MTNLEAIKMLTAKVECMQRETSGTDIDCNLRNCDDCELCYAQGTTGEQRKALNMAIFALQALDEIYAFIMKSEASETTDGVLEIFDALEAQGLKQEEKNSNESSLTQKGLDTISRQAAIDAVSKYKKEHGYAYYDCACEIEKDIKQLPSAQPEWNNHTVACLLAELFDDTCACNYNGIDEWLPEKCELLDSCPNPVGVACWEQYLKHRAERRTDEGGSDR